jgi:hypothetical protein
MRFKGKLALFTRGGLGRAMSAMFARERAKVVVNYPAKKNFVLWQVLVWCLYCAFTVSTYAQPNGSQVWSSEPPSDIPFPLSKELPGIAFTGRRAQYAKADTWYPSWASNNNMYSPWTDGEVNGLGSSSKGDHATTGFATIIGNDPMILTITDAGVYHGDPKPYFGRYPSANLVHDGVWYYGTYCLMDGGKDSLGPFVGFRYSTDFGKTWHDTLHTPLNPLFPEHVRPGEKVRMGAPHFVDFGKNSEHSPDGMAYLVAHGTTEQDQKPREADESWITGDQIFLARVRPSIRNINDVSKWEFYAGRNKKGKAVWTHEFNKIRPLMDWNNSLGSVTITYDAPLKKYLTVVTNGQTTISRFNSFILESNEITGPWKLVTYMKNFGEQGYFLNFPSKFIGQDGRTLWLAYSANFANLYLPTHYLSDPPGGGYWLTLQEVNLLDPKLDGDRQVRPSKGTLKGTDK